MRRFEIPIVIGRPYLPDFGAFSAVSEEVWQARILSNDGPQLRKFHSELAAYLDVEETNLALFCNGTTALENGLKALGVDGGEVITTPFSFVGTAHAIVRAGAKPVFADIDERTLCLDPASCERLIRPGVTKAIVPVHVYGFPCDVDGFADLSRRYGLKIVYDAAHAFGEELRGRHLVTFGDMSMVSFHPTKIFHTCEGGLLTFRDESLQQRLFDLRNFAIRSETSCVSVGGNAKMNELQAVMGILNLRVVDDLLSCRKRIHRAYADVLAGMPRIRFLSPEELGVREFKPNYSYCPVMFEDFRTRERVYGQLKDLCNVYARRYFYPLITDCPSYSYGRGTCPVAEDAARRVLSLPTFHGLAPEDARDVARDVVELLEGRS